MSERNTSITFLGTGTSVGVPVIGCSCPVCGSTDPLNNRTRSSIIVRSGEICILVDSGPDLREQALREKLTRLDAVLYTHCHVDHVVGFDELRAFCWARESPLPLHASASTLGVLKTMFGWAFHESNTHRGYIKPDAREFHGPFSVGSLSITPLPVVHGTVDVSGFLFKDADGKRIAYLPDVKEVPEETLALMSGLDLLIIDALRDSPHPTHLSVSEACAISDRLSPRETLLTHLSHDLDHHELSSRLPHGILPAHDGLTIRI